MKVFEYPVKRKQVCKKKSNYKDGLVMRTDKLELKLLTRIKESICKCCIRIILDCLGW